MKRHITFKMANVFPDWKTTVPKELIKRLERRVKVVGDLIVGKPLNLYFEDGFIYKTNTLDMHGFINKYNDDDELEFVTLCTKDMYFEFEVTQKDFKLKIDEQLKIGA